MTAPQSSSSDRSGLRQRAENCAKYDFDTVEMIECKWALWDEILEALHSSDGGVEGHAATPSGSADRDGNPTRDGRTIKGAGVEPGPSEALLHRIEDEWLGTVELYSGRLRCGFTIDELSTIAAALRSSAVAQAVQEPIGYAPYHPRYGWRVDLAAKNEQIATAVAMRSIDGAAAEGWSVRPIYAALPSPPAALPADPSLQKAQRTLIGAPGNDQLSQLWNAIVANTKGDGFWIGEILLTTLEREVGFNPSAVPSTSRTCPDCGMREACDDECPNAPLSSTHKPGAA